MGSEKADSNFDDRFITETGMAADIAKIAEPVIKELGLRLVRIIISGREGCTLQIMIDRSESIVTVEDCAKLSRQLSPVLDVEDIISGKYNLEVSSPGIDRPLVRLSDFVTWAGYEAKIEMRELIDGRKRFRGLIEGVENAEVLLKVQLEGYEEEQIIGLPTDLISTAKLVLTDDLIKASLAQNKQD